MNHSTLISGILLLTFCASVYKGLRWLLCTSESLSLVPSRSLNGKHRSALLDNAKFFLLITVIMFHSLIFLFPSAVGGDVVKVFFHTWAPRTFAFISGVVSRDPPTTSRLMLSMFRLVVPLVLFCALPLWLPKQMRASQLPPEMTFKRNLLWGEYCGSWYLFGLVLWRLWGALLHPLPKHFRLGLAICFAACAGYYPLPLFMMGRALAVFPLFVTGQLFPWEQATTRLPWSGANAALGGFILLVIFVVPCSGAGQKIMSDMPSFAWEPAEAHLRPSPALTTDYLFFWLRGLFLNTLELIKGLVFLLLVCPRSHSAISELGKHTIYAYLLHIPLVFALRPWAPFLASQCSSPVHFWAAFLICAAVVNAALSSGLTRAVFGVFVEPVWLEHLMICKAQPMPFKADIERPAAVGRT